jgi:sugar/nucleoside kinase (ribokinase family)
LSLENINISLKKDYSIICYFTEDNIDEVIFDFNYQLNIDVQNTELKKINADFWIFVTNKEESEKILESSFTKSLDLSQAIQENNQLSLSFKDSVKLKRYEYDQGIKIFLSLN